MSELPDAWKDALERVAKARSSRIHMPAALLVALDMIEAGEMIDGTIAFAIYERRFRTLMKQVRGSAAATAWEPFYHLSTTSAIWCLYLGDAKADFTDISGRPKSRSTVTNRSDRAKFCADLARDLVNRSTATAIRDSIYELLTADGNSDSEQLLRTHLGNPQPADG